MEPGIIKITERTTTDLEASGARLSFTVRGENLVFGNAAVEKCAEVRDAIARIKATVGEVEVALQGADFVSDTGMFSKSSKAIYSVEITLKTLDQLPAILGVFAQMKNVEMNSIEWQYDEDDARLNLVADAVVRAKAKADRMVTGIGYRIVGLRSCSDSFESPQNDTTRFATFGDETLLRGKASSAPMQMGMTKQGRKEVSAVATLEFYVAANES